MISSRYQKGSKITGVPILRIFLANIDSIIFRIFFPIKNVKDYTCGFRAYDVNLLKNAYKNIKYTWEILNTEAVKLVN